MALAVCSLGDLVAFCRRGGDRIAARYQLDHGEGLLLGLCAERAAGRSIYPDLGIGPELIDNYPPLYLWLMAAGDGRDPLANLHRGRWLSFLAALLAAAMIATMAGLASPGSLPLRVFAGGAAASFFLALEPVLNWSSLARVDMFALAATLTGVMALRLKGRTGRALGLAFFLVALWTKQSMIAAPLALIVVIGSRRPREAFLLGLLAILLGLGGVYLMQRATDGRFLFHVVTANRTAFSFALLGHHLLQFLAIAWPLIPPALLGLCCAREQDARRRFFKVWCCFAAFGLVALGKTGSATNYMLEMLAILAVLAGTGFGALATWAVERPRKAALALPFLILPVLIWPPDLDRGRFRAALPYRQPELEAGMETVWRELGRLDGDILSWDMSLPVLAGKRLVYHPFLMPDLVRRGLFSDESLLQRIEAGDFALVVTSFDLDDAERFRAETRQEAPFFTERVLNAVKHRYRLDRILPLPAHLGGAWVCYRPR